MDRFVVREPRAGANFPQGNQMMTFSTNAGGNNVISTENVYYDGSYTTELDTIRHVPNPGYMSAPQINTQGFPQTLVPCQGQVMSGIDPRYLAGYSDNRAHFIATGQPLQREMIRGPMNVRFGDDYQNRSFTGPEKQQLNTFAPQTIMQYPISEGPRSETTARPKNFIAYDDNMKPNDKSQQGAQVKLPVKNSTPPIKKAPANEAPKKEEQNVAMTRSEKLKALHKSGPRAFSGPVEKVLKWHKALQDIGVSIFYEIVAKCVSVRSGESCAKILVVRDDNGPAMQVVYYEIDFLLTEIQPSCVIRVIGRMMAGTCRLQAFSVRPATGDDVAMLPRRAAVAAHHVARLCTKYGTTP